MKYFFLLFTLLISPKLKAEQIKPKGIIDYLDLSEIIVLAEIQEITDSTVTVYILDNIIGKVEKSIITYQLKRISFYETIRGFKYKVGQKELLFLSNPYDNKYSFKSDYHIESDSVMISNSGFQHGSYYKQYFPNDKKQLEWKSYGYENLINSLKYFKPRISKLNRLIKKDSFVIDLHDSIGYDPKNGPEIKLKSKKLIKVLTKSPSNKRLLEELIDNVLTTYW